MRFCAAVGAAATIVACLAGPGRAEEPADPRTMIFSGRDIWRSGVYVYSGLLFAPGGFEQDGFMLKVVAGGGVYRYIAGGLGGEQVVGAEWMAQVLPGFRIKRGEAEFKIFFGPEVQRHKLWPDDPGNRSRGQNIGIRFASELWYEPTRNTLVAADVSLSSLIGSRAARLAFGYRILEEMLEDGVYFGPEVQYIGSEGYRQMRYGIHLTSMKTEATEWSAGIGFARDTDGRSSAYARLGLSQKLTD